MPMQPYEHDDEFLNVAHPEPGEPGAPWVIIIGTTLLFLTAALGVGGGLGWAIAKYGPEDSFDVSTPYREWAARVGVQCPTTTASIRPLLVDGRLTRDEMGQVREIAYAARDVCDVPRIPSSD